MYDNTSVIGIFKIVSESGIGAGTRRIEAVTGEKAYQFMHDQMNLLKTVAKKLKTKMEDVPTKIEHLQQEIKELHKENRVINRKT